MLPACLRVHPSEVIGKIFRASGRRAGRAPRTSTRSNPPPLAMFVPAPAVKEGAGGISRRPPEGGIGRIAAADRPERANALYGKRRLLPDGAYGKPGCGLARGRPYQPCLAKVREAL